MASGTAIFDCQVTVTRRTDKATGPRNSAVAGAAYRSGERLKDEQTQSIHDYTKREGLDGTDILTPSDAPEALRDRETLWNNHEAKERRKDSQLFREVRVALPRAQDFDQNREMVIEWVKDEFVSKGMIADIAFHGHAENHNPHAHIMLTMRDYNDDGTFGNKNRSWNDYESFHGFSKAARVEMGMDAKSPVEVWREAWSTHVNQHLEQHGIDARISHEKRSEAEDAPIQPQGLSQAAYHMEKRGERTRHGDKVFERKCRNQAYRDKMRFHEQLDTIYDALSFDNLRQRMYSYWSKAKDYLAPFADRIKDYWSRNVAHEREQGRSMEQ